MRRLIAERSAREDALSMSSNGFRCCTRLLDSAQRSSRTLRPAVNQPANISLTAASPTWARRTPPACAGSIRTRPIRASARALPRIDRRKWAGRVRTVLVSASRTASVVCSAGTLGGLAASVPVGGCYGARPAVEADPAYWDAPICREGPTAVFPGSPASAGPCRPRCQRRSL